MISARLFRHLVSGKERREVLTRPFYSLEKIPVALGSWETLDCASQRSGVGLLDQKIEGTKEGYEGE